MKWKLMGLAAAGLALAPVVVRTPVRVDSDSPSTVDGLVTLVRAQGLRGREEIDAAIIAVADAFPRYSLWRLWANPHAALAAHQGWSHQYNTVLLLVVRGLGYEARLVHSARVRGLGGPWWLAGHTWAKVRFGGHWLDACASRRTNRVGDVGFVPLTPELPMRRSTRWAVGAALVPFVVLETWRTLLEGREVAAWVDRPRAEGL